MDKDQAKLVSSSAPGPPEDVRTGLSPAALERALLDNLNYVLARFPEFATPHDWYMALAYTVRDRLLLRWIKSVETLMQKEVRGVAYLSAEFLLGPHLGNNLINLGIYEQVWQAVARTGLDLNALMAQEEEPGLGNGGLGRLAACFLDSLATLEIPAIGYGIRYEFGIFDQEIHDGWQVENTDKWLRRGNPWEIVIPDISYLVNLGGCTEAYQDEAGRYRVRWIPGQVVKGVAYDTPILGYHVNTANILRLWKAEAVESFDFRAFNVGDYWGAVNQKIKSETISKILYPNDEPITGKVLRLAQQYFFVSCSLQDMIHLSLLFGNHSPTALEEFHHGFAVQLNDTHPSIAVAELMRLLIDEHLMDWEQAWHVTQQTFAYTNHTLLPEALEKWPLSLFAELLPRHLEIIYEINRRFLEEVKQLYPEDDQLLGRISLIDESGEKFVRMAHLAALGSHSINGVAALHTELLQQDVLKDFYKLYPDKFLNITNGVTLRRWLLLSNPRLAELITRHIGDKWITHPEEELRRLESWGENSGFREEWRIVKRKNKQRLAALIKKRTGITVSPDSLFDIQVKRMHEYKRQHLNVLHVITLYNRLKRNPAAAILPRTFIFGGKAAPSYCMAKLIIKLINSVAEVINHDPVVEGRLKVVFIPDFNVTSAQVIYPAADLSEQISTAGKEASGTGNMKFAFNGALTIGTLDGANVEIREEVGAENFFLFGLSAGEVRDLKAKGYHPWEYYHADSGLREAMDLIASGFFAPDDPELFKPIFESILYHDDYMLLADYQSYINCQDQVGLAFGDQEAWTRMSILNVARLGKFSSDRSIREYSQKIWGVRPVPVGLD